MHGSVAARIDSQDFWVFLDRLRTEYGTDTPQLLNFMSNIGAARIDSPGFCIGMDRVRTESLQF